MASQSYTNFRLQGIPTDARTRRDVQELVQRTLGLGHQITVVVHSLASSPIQKNSKVATLSFEPIPDAFPPKHPPEWRFTVPTSPGVDETTVIRPRCLVIDTHFHGLTPLHCKEDQDCSVDLIAVSGLGGHAFGSFKERGGPFMWLRDALPWEFPRFRIFTYGYDTQLQDSSSFQNITDLGKELRTSIHETRVAGSHKDNHIIFVGHSLGGLVIKEAAVAMKDADDELDKRILESTAAFFFFGVPHQGMATRFLVPLIKDQPNRALLETLGVHSPLLGRQIRDFPRAFGTKGPRVVSFYETKESPTAELVNGKWKLSGPPERLVDPASATYGSKSQHPIDRTHSEIVKFGGDYDRGYRITLVNLKQLEQRITAALSGLVCAPVVPNVPALDSRQHECLQSLAFKEQNRRRDDISPAEDTCTWILTDPRYLEWKRSSQGLLWIKGNPGAGKSTVMKHILVTMQEDVNEELVASFFVHGRGILLQKTLIGLYRALLNSLLNYFPDCLDSLTRRFEENERQFGSWEKQKWECHQSELQKCLHEFLLEASGIRPIIIYIDALDECGVDAAQKLLEELKRLHKAAGAQNCSLKICFSSRHYPILGFESVPTIYVEDQNNRDIRWVVRHSLEEIEPVNKRRQIENEIVSKAQGGFQWAVLVVAKAAELSRRGVNAQVIYEAIKTTPAELNQLYSGLLEIADIDERRHTKKLFQWVLCAQRPLQIAELREALALDTDPEPRSIDSLRNSRHYCDSLQDTERRIQDLSKGLIEIKTREVFAITVDDESFVREVQFIHQSVPDFLTKGAHDGLGLFDNERSPFGHSHSGIARACIMYLGLQELPAAAERSWYYLTSEFPLASYAVQYHALHVQVAESEGVSQDALVAIVQRWVDDNEKFDDIMALWAVLLKGLGLPNFWPVRKSTIWHFMACFGLTRAFDTRLKRDANGIDQPDGLGNTPLFLSIGNGHDPISTILLDQAIQTQSKCRHRGYVLVAEPRCLDVSFSIDPNITNFQDATPMSLAIKRNAGGLIKLLVQAGASLNAGEESERSAIGYAIGSEDEDLLEELVNRGIYLGDTIKYFSHISTPTAAHMRMMRRVFSLDSSCASSDLMCDAVHAKRKDLIEALLECNISPDTAGGTRCPETSPLCYAIKTEDMNLLAKLVEKNADLSGAVDYLTTLISREGRRSDEIILRELLRSGASGSTHHMLVFTRRRRADLVQLLLEFNVSPNAPHEISPLIHAIERRSLEVIRTLVSFPDLQVNAALEHAFSFGFRKRLGLPGDRERAKEENNEMIRLLIHHKNADLNQPVYAGPGSGKMRMLTAAADKGRERITALLLESKSIEVDHKSFFEHQLPSSFYFPYRNAPPSLKSVSPSAFLESLEALFRQYVCDDYVWKVAPLLMATAARRGKIAAMLLDTGQISEASVVDAYFVAQSFGYDEILSSLQASIPPGRRLYQGGPGRQKFEIWIGDAETSSLPHAAEIL